MTSNERGTINITFDDYVRFRLQVWGREFGLGRVIRDGSCLRGYTLSNDYGKNMLQVLIEHKGEMPARVVGYKPLTIPIEAMEIEDIVHDMHADVPTFAIVLRAYYCGSGKHSTDRLELAEVLLGRPVTRRQYYDAHAAGFNRVAGALKAGTAARRKAEQKPASCVRTKNG